jgi:transglutaminase-like putative cysteine protease
MVVEIPQLPAGQEAHAIVIYEITRQKIQPPADTSIYRVPKRLDRAMQLNLGPSPMVESKHPKVVAAAKKAVANADNAWHQVEAIANFVRANVQFKEGPLKGAARALLDGDGYTDELVSLFVAMCRSQKIPARTVFVKGDCYAEFYLEDDDGKGYWFPCVLTGNLPVGALDEVRPALQKGDNFKNPENTKENLRYVREFFQAASRGGGPKVEFLSEPVAN